MSSCPHPASSLKPSTAEQSGNSVTIKFCCVSCLAPITKQFMLSSPEPLPQVEAEIADLLTLPESDMPLAPAKVRRGENSPWRRYSTVTT